MSLNSLGKLNYRNAMIRISDSGVRLSNLGVGIMNLEVGTCRAFLFWFRILYSQSEFFIQVGIVYFESEFIFLQRIQDQNSLFRVRISNFGVGIENCEFVSHLGNLQF